MSSDDEPDDKKPVNPWRQTKISSEADTEPANKTEPASKNQTKPRTKISIDEPQVDVAEDTTSAEKIESASKKKAAAKK